MKNFLNQIFGSKGDDSKTPPDSNKTTVDESQEESLNQDPNKKLPLNAFAAGIVHPPPKA